jgi:membrane-associated phospholipid phosphatase
VRPVPSALRSQPYRAPYQVHHLHSPPARSARQAGTVRLRPALRALDTLSLQRARPKGGRPQAMAAVMSTASERGVLWLVTTGVLAAIGGRARRAGGYGLAAWGLASAAAALVKPVIGRRRPHLAPQVGAATRSSSMPSSHAAAAVAYATAAAISAPPSALALVPLAGGVAWSRIGSGRHFPSDVAAGVGLGVVVGIAVGWVARRRPAVNDPARRS